MTKYEFHELWKTDPNEYEKRRVHENSELTKEYRRLRYQNNPEVRKNRIEQSTEWRKNHPTWIIRNCTICGRFIPKLHSKFCSKCYPYSN
jgi:hypothetical protein